MLITQYLYGSLTNQEMGDQRIKKWWPMLADLIHMAFDNGIRFWKVLAHIVYCQLWPCYKVPTLNIF
jgi:hypothetical protein